MLQYRPVHEDLFEGATEHEVEVQSAELAETAGGQAAPVPRATGRPDVSF